MAAWPGRVRSRAAGQGAADRRRRRHAAGRPVEEELMAAWGTENLRHDPCDSSSVPPATFRLGPCGHGYSPGCFAKAESWMSNPIHRARIVPPTPIALEADGGPMAIPH